MYEFVNKFILNQMSPDIDIYFRDPSLIASKHNKEIEKFISMKVNEFENLLKENYLNLTKVSAQKLD